MAKTKLKFILMCVCILAPETTTGEPEVITLAPLNRVVYEAAINTTMMTCQSSDTSLDWMIRAFAYSGSSEFSLLTANDKIDFPFNELFAIDHPQGTEFYTLVVLNATISPSDRASFSTAGIYLCYDAETSTRVGSQLVVIRAGPICSSNFTQSTSVLQSGDAMQLSCTIVYGAFRRFPIDAVMTWSVNGQPIPADNATFTINSSPQEITATSTLVVNQNSDATYECGTTFSQPAVTPPPDIADNAPDYLKTCTISPLSSMTPCSSSSSASIGDECLPNLRNIAVHEGQLNTVMNLATDPESVTWSVLPTSDESSLQNIIDFGCNKNPLLTELYDVNQAGLVIKDATTIGSPISTAGLYVGQCANNDNKIGAKLLVIRRGPECSSISIDSTSSSVSCNVTFADIVLHPMYPIITWKRNGVFLASDTLQAERTDLYVSFATSTITSDSGVPENYECELTFAAPTEIQYPWIATNAPDFKESCSTTG